MSSSLRPHGLEPTRLLCPWGFPGRNTGVDCYFLLREIFATGGQTHTSCIVWQVLYRWATREPPSLCQWSLRFSHFLRFTVSWTLVLSPCVLFTVLSWFFFGPQFRYEEASGYSGNESVFSVSLLSFNHLLHFHDHMSLGVPPGLCNSKPFGGVGALALYGLTPSVSCGHHFGLYYMCFLGIRLLLSLKN